MSDLFNNNLVKEDESYNVNAGFNMGELYYIVKFDTGAFWCGTDGGSFSISKQYRKAYLFATLDKAIEAGKKALSNRSCVEYTKIKYFKVLEVELWVVDEIEVE